jgi:hypothetical protein
MPAMLSSVFIASEGLSVLPSDWSHAEILAFPLSAPVSCQPETGVSVFDVGETGPHSALPVAASETAQAEEPAVALDESAVLAAVGQPPSPLADVFPMFQLLGSAGWSQPVGSAGWSQPLPKALSGWPHASVSPVVCESSFLLLEGAAQVSIPLAGGGSQLADSQPPLSVVGLAPLALALKSRLVCLPHPVSLSRGSLKAALVGGGLDRPPFQRTQ